jgi:hypothetical protein
MDSVSSETPQEYGGDQPWIFYLGEKNLLSPDGIVIVRPKAFPFSLPFQEGGGDTNSEDIAVAWKNSDAEVAIMHTRLVRQWFDEVFVQKLKTNFKSIEPIENSQGVVDTFRLIEATEKNEIRALGLENRFARPVVAPVDCAIITTLNEEFRQVVTNFKLKETQPGVAVGWYNTDNPFSVVAVKCEHAGSVSSALATNKLIQDYSPKSVFLIGRCGAMHEEYLQEGDVIIAEWICAYEYQALKVEGGKEVVAYDQQSHHSSSDLRHAAHLLSDKWSYPTDTNMIKKLGWGTKRAPRAFVGDFACGFKLIRRDKEWFEQLRHSLVSCLVNRFI